MYTIDSAVAVTQVSSGVAGISPRPPLRGRGHRRRARARDPEATMPSSRRRSSGSSSDSSSSSSSSDDDDYTSVRGPFRHLSHPCSLIFTQASAIADGPRATTTSLLSRVLHDCSAEEPERHGGGRSLLSATAFLRTRPQFGRHLAARPGHSHAQLWRPRHSTGWNARSPCAGNPGGNARWTRRCRNVSAATNSGRTTRSHEDTRGARMTIFICFAFARVLCF